MFGLGSFLLAHLAYLWAFAGRVRRPLPLWPALPYAVLALIMLSQLWPAVPAALRAPVVVYVIALSGMAALAAAVWWRRRDRCSAFAAVGALLFVASDGVLAWDRFLQPFDAARAIVLTLYWLAQWHIARSAVDGR